MRIRPTATALLAALTLAVGAPAHAEKADRNKPMNIEADALRHDELKQVSVFTGRVVMTKGTIVLRGERLEVHQDPDGFQQGVLTAAPGQRAFFRQKRDTAPGAPGEYIEGEGEVIEYDGRSDDVRLIRRAELRRYRDAVLTDRLSGARIVYNNITDTFSVDGQKTAPGTDAGTPDGRVRAMIAPKEQPPAAGAAPAAEPAAPAAALRQSTELGGAAK